tara:strand:+ start:184 stop:615 length:432 start_codon:yes stop_codon:yes gene_type:complete
MNAEPLKMTKSLTNQHMSKKLLKIFVRDLVIKCSIGVYKREKTNPQRVRINLDLTLQGPQEALNDSIQNTVCYAEITSGIAKIATKRHINLVETLAERIADMCLTYTSVQIVQVKVEKLDVLKHAGSVGVEIERYNQDIIDKA